MNPSISEVLEKVRRRDNARFEDEAYLFVSEALEATIRRHGREKHSDVRRHVSGAELSEGVADCALERFGPLTFQVLSSWGITTTRDIGDIVYSLIEAKMLSKSDEDSIEDFDSVYDFRERFMRIWE